MFDQTTDEIKFPHGVVRGVFDNEQVIGKSYRIKNENKVPSSIVTSNLYISIDPCSALQNNVDFALNNWLFNKPKMKIKKKH